MKHKWFKKALAALLSVSMLCTMGSGIGTASAQQQEEPSSIVEMFNHPNDSTKVATRYWVPDAGADYEVMKQELTDLYNAGYGGIELTSITLMNVL